MAKVKDRLIFENKKMEAVAQRKSNREQKLRAKESRTNKLVEKAKTDAIVEGTKQKAIAAAEIESMAHRAREELRGKVAALAIAGAEKILKREIDASAHKDLIDQLVSEI